MDIGLNEHHPLPDHVVMNYLLEAPRFLGALRWWPKDSKVAIASADQTAEHRCQPEGVPLLPAKNFQESMAPDHVAVVSIICRSSTVYVRVPTGSRGPQTAPSNGIVLPHSPRLTYGS